MKITELFSRTKPKSQAVAAAQNTKREQSELIVKIAQEFQDRSRKDIQKWRRAIMAAEKPDDPRWFMYQDVIDDISLDAHIESVKEIRKSATLNHRFYVTDRKTGEKLEEQTNLLETKWFYDFLDEALEAIVRKYTVMQFFREGDFIRFDTIPYRNVCPQFKRIYMEVGGSSFIDYATLTNVIEIQHRSKFGIINSVIPNVIWKRNVLQANAEFSERFGMPLITATTSNKADVPKIEAGLKNLGEAGTGVLPNGANIQVHALANAGNPEKVYLDPAKFHDQQISKRFLGSTTLTDEGANRAQTEVHQDTLDYKLSLSDKRLITFSIVQDLFPILKQLGLPFDNTKMSFQFDETEDLTLEAQWKITSEAAQIYDLSDQEVAKTFNLPIVGRKAQTGGFEANFR